MKQPIKDVPRFSQKSEHGRSDRYTCGALPEGGIGNSRLRCAQKENDVSACFRQVTDGLRSPAFHWVLLPRMRSAELFHGSGQKTDCNLLTQEGGH